MKSQLTKHTRRERQNCTKKGHWCIPTEGQVSLDSSVTIGCLNHISPGLRIRDRNNNYMETEKWFFRGKFVRLWKDELSSEVWARRVHLEAYLAWDSFLTTEFSHFCLMRSLALSYTYLVGPFRWTDHRSWPLVGHIKKGDETSQAGLTAAISLLVVVSGSASTSSDRQTSNTQDPDLFTSHKLSTHQTWLHEQAVKVNTLQTGTHRKPSPAPRNWWDWFVTSFWRNGDVTLDIHDTLWHHPHDAVWK
jgi:hypothetical protein